MGLIVIPKKKNVGASLDDINANFAYLDKQGGDKSVSFAQESPAAVWVILHNMNKYPSVTVLSDEGEVIICGITYTNENTVTLTFSEETSGTAYLN